MILTIHLQWHGCGRSQWTHFLMDSGECLPKSKLGINEWYPLDKMAVCKLWPLCINEQELDGSRSRWTEWFRNQLIVMEAGSLSCTAALPSIMNSSQLVLNIMIYRKLTPTHCILTFTFGNPNFCDFTGLENSI